ncbi:hypothetical protein [Tenacibaculum piscium]|uniref:hypothetical protein n=1 Tax=Tenacibaculum piscium TaxID=1458515 RepID=UPI001356512B|nr:hypothetical protein [Tenacibaculum piscium]
MEKLKINKKHTRQPLKKQHLKKYFKNKQIKSLVSPIKGRRFATANNKTQV